MNSIISMPQSSIGNDNDNATEEDVKTNGQTATSGTPRFVTFAPERPPQQPLQSGFSSMKRGIHSLMSTVDAALKHSNQAAAIQPSPYKKDNLYF